MTRLFTGLLHLMVPVMLLTAGFALAQPTDPCNLPPGEYCTFTQGGYGTDCNGNNPGCLRDSAFAAGCFPGGIVIGGDFTLTFTSSEAVAAFLPAGGTAGTLTQSEVDPTDDTDAGVFAGQVLALAITLGLGDCGARPDIGPLVFQQGWHEPAAFPGTLTVQQVFDLANEVLGGNEGALPEGITVSDLNDIITAVNENFDDCAVAEGLLVHPDCDETIPVKMLSFEAISGLNLIELRWRTASERDVSHYEISRRVGDSEMWSHLADVASQGNNTSGFSYSYVDRGVQAGTMYTYRLTAHDINGTVTTFGELASATPGDAPQVTTYALHQNYPNPFNPTTSIRFDLLDASNVTLKIFTVTGREVATLANGAYAAGAHTVAFDASNLATGIYLYRIEAGSFTAVRKLVLMK